ncbi:DUF1330 domain-containing protein [Streptomyces sp. NPDC057636]|uniref:DUF1330 domain-containing protein n=1 Tax=Streptomyces sp. NPDC057636 TaxID=3346189 RepID=UPI003675AA63
MTAYAIAALRNTTVPNEEVFDYMERIQSTLDPFGGGFLVHGAQPEDIEGAWPGGVVVISFPDKAAAHGWYDSDAYQELIPLRTRNLDGEVIFVEGVPEGYDPSSTAARMRAEAARGRV